MENALQKALGIWHECRKAGSVCSSALPSTSRISSYIKLRRDLTDRRWRQDSLTYRFVQLMVSFRCFPNVGESRSVQHGAIHSNQVQVRDPVYVVTHIVGAAFFCTCGPSQTLEDRFLVVQSPLDSVSKEGYSFLLLVDPHLRLL